MKKEMKKFAKDAKIAKVNLLNFKGYRLMIFSQTNQLQLLCDFLSLKNEYEVSIVKITKIEKAFTIDEFYYVIRFFNLSKDMSKDMIKYINENYIPHYY